MVEKGILKKLPMIVFSRNLLINSIGAAMDHFPDNLVGQLKAPGRMVFI